MQMTLEIIAGPLAGTKVPVPEGRAWTIGRLAEANLSIAHDTLLSNLHFSVECTADSCRLRDLNSRFGTRVNDSPVREAVLRDGDQVVAGQTSFVIRIEAAASSSPAQPTVFEPHAVAPPSTAAKPAAPSPAAMVHARVLEILRGQREPLFALVDGARDIKVLETLQNRTEEIRSLYEGQKGEELAPFAPYLLHLPTRSALLETLVRGGWGNAWGVYLTCGEPFAELRKHLRRFLLVRMPDRREVYFRFYDPRVLRAFLPACTAEEAAQLFGPVRAFLLEGKNLQTMLQLTAERGGVRQGVVTLP